MPEVHVARTGEHDYLELMEYTILWPCENVWDI